VDEPNPATGQPWAESLAEFSAVVDVLRASELVYRLIARPDSENQVLVLNDSRDDMKESVQVAYKSSLSTDKGRERRRQRLPVVDVHPIGPDSVVPAAQEVIEIVGKVPNARFSLFGLAFGEAERSVIEKQTVDLLGWTTLGIDLELEHIDDLSATLDSVSFIDTEGSPQ
jgi:hypothetical protein